MAEELQDASYTLPRVMLWATIINGGMMFVMAVTVAYCIGDLDAGKHEHAVPYISDGSTPQADTNTSLTDTNRIPIHPDLLQRHRIPPSN